MLGALGKIWVKINSSSTSPKKPTVKNNNYAIAENQHIH